TCSELCRPLAPISINKFANEATSLVAVWYQKQRGEARHATNHKARHRDEPCFPTSRDYRRLRRSWRGVHTSDGIPARTTSQPQHQNDGFAYQLEAGTRHGRPPQTDA